MQTIAIIGPTASGKSALAIDAARHLGARILSLDSLSIYRQIDIASAKPTLPERKGILHYGIDVLEPDQHFSVATFIALYRQAKAECEAAGVPLIIVGGTSFYLKSLIDGMSELPPDNAQTAAEVKKRMQSPQAVYAMLARLDPESMQKIEPADRYRIEKMLTLHLLTGTRPSEWFRAHPPVPVLKDYTLYEIATDREQLRERIRLRTEQMIAKGLIDEVAGLERRYGRAPNAMKAIGIVEVLDYLDGRMDFIQMRDAIATHTAQLAKRQETFNRNQFPTRQRLETGEIFTRLSAGFA